MSGEAWASLDRLRTCLGTAIAEAKLPPVCALAVMPGQGVAHDFVYSCDDKDGLAWVQLTAQYPSTNVAQPTRGVTKCGADYGIGVNIGIIRSFPIPEDGEPPEVSVFEAMALQQLREMEVIRYALVCCYPEDVALGSYTPIGPQGGAFGGAWVANIALVD